MSKEDKASFEITVIQVKTTSSNETLRQNVREIANTISRSITPQVRQLPQLPPSNQQPTQLPLWNEGQGVEEISNDFVEQAPELDVSKNKTKKAYRPKSPKILDNLDFRAGDVPFKEYFERKKSPDEDSKRYLVIAGWFKEHRGLREITSDHVHTCYRFMGWATPDDPSKTFRNLKSGNQWMNKGAEKGGYAINHIGENVLIEMEKGNGIK